MILVILLAFHHGCGGEDTRMVETVTVRHLTKDEFTAEHGSFLGYATWWPGASRCEIDMIHRSEYEEEPICNGVGDHFAVLCGSDLYMFILGHEHRHCLEGRFHGPPGKESSWDPLAPEVYRD